MLRVTKLADYGIVLMTYMACPEGPATHNARDLSREVQLPLPMVSKILKSLAREGLLTSHRGIKGGYTLSRRPEETSIAEIIRALEGPIALTECTDRTHGDCGLEQQCPTRGNWHRINSAVRDALQRVTLADMVQPIPKCPTPLLEVGSSSLVQVI
jgi:FeS assembly SUF system regulator